MSTQIDEGFGLIAGRSQENAIAALAAAEAAGLDPSAVKTVAEGYVVPDAVLDEFEKASKAAAKKTTNKKPDGPADGDDSK